MDKNHVIIFTTNEDSREAENKRSFLESVGFSTSIKIYEVLVEGVTNLTMARAMIDCARSSSLILCNSKEMLKYFELLDIELSSISDLIGYCTMKELYGSNVIKADYDKYVNPKTTSNDKATKGSDIFTPITSISASTAYKWVSKEDAR